MHTKKNILQKFTGYIEKGRFVLPYCKTCRKTIWPPTNNCRICLNNLTLKNYKNKQGKIMEYFLDKFNNTLGNNIMILVELDEIILIGSLHQHDVKSRNIQGKKVRIKKCGFIDKKIFYQFDIVNN
jgi:uncharacterized OB-fold protein